MAKHVGVPLARFLRLVRVFLFPHHLVLAAVLNPHDVACPRATLLGVFVAQHAPAHLRPLLGTVLRIADRDTASERVDSTTWRPVITSRRAHGPRDPLLGVAVHR
jgi:hypothetical protein